MRVAILSLSCIALACPSALAQDSSATGFDPAAAIEGFLTDTTRLGADTATIGKLTEDGDSVTVENVAMAWSVPITAAGATVSVDMKVDVPSVTIKGLAPADGGGHTAAEIDVAAGTFTLTATMPDKPEPARYTIDITDYKVTDAAWGAFPTIKADPSAPLSRFAPLIDWGVAWSYQRGGFGRLATLFATGAERQEFAYGPVEVGPVVNGTVASLEYPAFSVEQSFEEPQPDGSKKTVNMVVDYKEMRLEGLDLKPLAQLLTGTGSLTGPANITASTQSDGISLKVDTVEGEVGGYLLEDVTIDPTRGPLLAKFDPIVVGALAGTPPAPREIATVAVDAIGAIGIGREQWSDLKVSWPGGTAGIARVLTEGLNANGLKRYAIEGIAVEAPEGKGGLEAVEIRDVTFPPRQEVVRMITESSTTSAFNPATDLAALPTLGGFTIKGLLVESALLASQPVKLDLFDLSLSGYVNAIPTRLALSLEGFEMPLSLVQNPQASMILSAIDADPVTADVSLTLGYNEADGSVTLDEEATIGKVGSLSANAALTGIPKVIFENPMRANEAIATAAVKGLTVRFEDEGITPFLVGMMAEQAGISAAQFAQGMAQQVGMQVGMLTGDTALANDLSGTVEHFLADPRSFLVSASPAAAVPFAQLIGAAMAAPQQIPQLLNLTVTANP